MIHPVSKPASQPASRTRLVKFARSPRAWRSLPQVLAAAFQHASPPDFRWPELGPPEARADAETSTDPDVLAAAVPRLLVILYDGNHV